jgi:hypothetical protein
MLARNPRSEGAAALSGVVWALLIEFLIKAEFVGLSALRSVIGAAFIHTGAAFIHTRNSLSV